MELRSWILLALSVTAAIRFLSFRYIYGLQRFKGPLLASFTDAWRAFYYYSNTEIPFGDLHERFGDIVRIGPNALSFRDPQAIRDIFGAGKTWKKSDVYFVNMGVSKGELLPTLFSSTDPTYHKNVRRVLNPFFTQASVLTYEPSVESTIEDFTTELDIRFVNKGGTEGSIDFHTWLSYYAFDSISKLTYSEPHGFISRAEDMHGIISWVANFLKYGFIVGQMPSMDVFFRHNPVLMWLEKRGWYRGDAFPGTSFALQRIWEREHQKSTQESADRREDLLDKFRRANRERPEYITDREVLGISLTLLIAGAETSAISLTAIFYYLLRTPDCYSKLQKELDTHLQPVSSTTDPTYFRTPFSEARKLPYLRACIQEAFRMHPAFGMMLERIVPPSGATICGSFIPGGTLVGCNAWVVQRDQKTFGEDCDGYRPERWLEDDESTRRMERAMFNFGEGNHVCLGQNIALMNIYKLVPSLIRTYEISLVDPEKEWKIINGANMKQTDFNVRLRRRRDT